jgi:transcriptional regulator with XRE-family HTH domain
MELQFREMLRDWRSRRGASQLALALEAGVSARHVSFLETGRARPSREMVLRLAEALDLPLRERNGLLLSAGFAPRFGQRPLSSDELEQARRAVRLMLEAHEPYPAFALDRYWDVVDWNRPLALLLADVAPDEEALRAVNALDLVLRPGPVREQIVNWEQVATAVLRRVRRQVVRAAADERLQAMWQEARTRPGVAGLLDSRSVDEPPPVLVPMIMRQGDRTHSWINTLAVFGAAGDVTLDELVVESFFPADEATRRYVEQAAGL